MNLFFIVVILLCLSLATAVNFTQVFEWPAGLNYEWPSEEKRIQALGSGAFKPQNIEPIFMAVYGTRIFLSLEKYVVIPVTLGSLPTSSETSAPPKLTPFPSWDMHKDEHGDCNKIEEAKGLEVDSFGRLWVIDSGSENCNAKLWIFNLANNDKTELIHRFSFAKYLADLVLDETPNGYFAYMARWRHQHIVVFSLGKNQSWTVDTPGVEAYSIARSPKKEPRQIYLSNSRNFDTSEFFSISATALRSNGTQTAYPKLIGQWTEILPYRMLMDNHGTMYAAFYRKNYIASWNPYQSMQEQRFLEDRKLNTVWPFTFALDSSGTFWMTEMNKTATRPTYKLLKAAFGAKPCYISDCQTTVSVVYTLPVPSTTTVKPDVSCEEGVRLKEERPTEESTNSALTGSLAFFLVLSCTFNLWLSLRMRKMQNFKEQCNADEGEMRTVPNCVSPEISEDEI